MDDDPYGIPWHADGEPPPIEPPLHRAARLGDIESMARIVAAGTPIDAMHDYSRRYGRHLFGVTPLMVAAASTQGASAATVRWLLEHGADPAVRGRGHATAATWAAGWGASVGWKVDDGRTQDHAERLALLLDRGTPPDELDGHWESLLAHAASTGDPARVRVLLERGARVDPTTGLDWSRYNHGHVTDHHEMAERGRRAFGPLVLAGWSVDGSRPPADCIPLFNAAASGSPECVSILLAAGADAKALDVDGGSALLFASHPEIVRLLAAAGAPLPATRWGQDALDVALGSDWNCEVDLPVARELLALGLDIVGGPRGDRLGSAAQSMRLSAMRFLLEQGADPNHRAESGWTPLHHAAFPFERSMGSPPERSAECIALLLDAGAEIDARTDDGRTPLFEAALGDGVNVPAVRILLERGADPDPVDDGGVTPLMCAAMEQSLAAVEMLLARGADPTRVDAAGRTVVDWAAWTDFCSTAEGPGSTLDPKQLLWRFEEYRRDDAAEASAEELAVIDRLERAVRERCVD